MSQKTRHSYRSKFRRKLKYLKIHEDDSDAVYSVINDATCFSQQDTRPTSDNLYGNKNICTNYYFLLLSKVYINQCRVSKIHRENGIRRANTKHLVSIFRRYRSIYRKKKAVE